MSGLTSVQKEMIASAVQAAVAAVTELLPRNVPGVVMSVDPTNRTAEVSIAGPDQTSFPAEVAVGVTLFPGDTCLVEFNNSGAIVRARRRGDADDWHTVGGEGEPQYEPTWQHAAGTTELGYNGPAQLMFTRRSDRVELRGRAERISGSSDDVFPLPENYRPANDLLVRATGDLGTDTPLAIDMATGMLTVVAGVNTLVVDGISFIGVPVMPA